MPLLILSFSELSRVQSTELTGRVKKKKKGRQVDRPLIYNTAGAEKHFQGALGARRGSNHVFIWAVRKPQERHPDDVDCPLIGGSKENSIKSRDCLKDPPNLWVSTEMKTLNVFLHVTRRDKESQSRDLGDLFL